MLKGYVEKTRQYSYFRFIIEITAILFVLKMFAFVLGTFVLSFFSSPEEVAVTTTEVLSKQGSSYLLVVSLLVSPLVETLLGQWLPMLLLGFLWKDSRFLILGSALLFAAEHAYAGLINVVVTFPVGIILSWTFLRYWSVSWFTAFWVTTAIHLLHNSIALGLFFAYMATA